MLAAWKKFWFTPEDAFNLGAIRFFLCCGGAVFYFFLRDVHPESFFQVWKPISFYRLLPGQLSWETVEWIRWIWLVSIFLAGLGVAFRFTIVVGALAGVFVNGYNYNFGWVYHSGHLYTMSLCILAFSRAGDGFRVFTPRREARNPSGAYRWPVKLIQCYVVYVFFLCGLQKIWMAGSFEWATSNSFYNLLVSVPAQPPLNLWLQDQAPWVSNLFAGGALFVVELAAPLALVNRHFALAYAIIWSFFHVMVKATFGIHTMFFSQILAYSAFIEWPRFFALFPFTKRKTGA